MSIYKLLDRMLSLVENAPTMPFLSFKLIRSQDLQNLIEQSVSELPEELAEARQLVSHEEQILSSARRQAAEIVAKAEEEAKDLVGSAHEQVRNIVSESEVIKSVNIEAERIRDQVKSEAQRIYQITEQEIKTTEEESKRRIRLVMDSSIIEAENIRRGANSYAESVLHELERTTMGAISIIQNGQKQLENTTKNISREEHMERFKVALTDVQNLPPDLLNENGYERPGIPPTIKKPIEEINQSQRQN